MSQQPSRRAAARRHQDFQDRFASLLLQAAEGKAVPYAFFQFHRARILALRQQLIATGQLQKGSTAVRRALSALSQSRSQQVQRTVQRTVQQTVQTPSAIVQRQGADTGAIGQSGSGRLAARRSTNGAPDLRTPSPQLESGGVVRIGGISAVRSPTPSAPQRRARLEVLPLLAVKRRIGTRTVHYPAVPPRWSRFVPAQYRVALGSYYDSAGAYRPGAHPDWDAQAEPRYVRQRAIWYSPDGSLGCINPNGWIGHPPDRLLDINVIQSGEAYSLYNPALNRLLYGLVVFQTVSGDETPAPPISGYRWYTTTHRRRPKLGDDEDEHYVCRFDDVASNGPQWAEVERILLAPEQPAQLLDAGSPARTIEVPVYQQEFWLGSVQLPLVLADEGTAARSQLPPYQAWISTTAAAAYVDILYGTANGTVNDLNGWENCASFEVRGGLAVPTTRSHWRSSFTRSLTGAVPAVLNSCVLQHYREPMQQVVEDRLIAIEGLTSAVAQQRQTAEVVETELAVVPGYCQLGQAQRSAVVVDRIDLRLGAEDEVTLVGAAAVKREG